MKHIVHFAKIIFAQTILCAIALLIVFVAVWLNPDCFYSVEQALTQNIDIVSASHALIAEVKALLLN